MVCASGGGVDAISYVRSAGACQAAWLGIWG
jgi:hypothetical protein